jgi:hypothetical protein
MKAHLLMTAALAAPFFFVHVARADEPAVIVVQNDQPASAPMPAPAPYERTTHGTPGAYSDPNHGDDDDSDGPRARKGFQMSIRTGYALPMGSIYAGEKMSQGFGGQVPFLFDIGGKVHKYIFVGGYLGLNFGGCGDLVANDCAAVSFRIGGEIIGSFRPGAVVNPWLGYGIGIEVSGISANNGTSSLSLFAPEFGHFMGGVDFRVSRGFGIGPFVDFALGEYTSASATVNNVTQTGNLADQKTLHEWLTLGAKFTIFP